MEPIKPIEGNLSNAQEQAIAVTEVMRERYWQQKAQRAASTVNASHNSAEPDNATEHQDSPQDESPVSATTNNTYAEFSVDQETKEVVVRIVDGASGELVRTIPPEQLSKEISKGRLSQNQIRRRNIRL